ncbi:MAG: Lrp/AsnC family transcriptional regulator [Nitriliruptoraceae bacterium]|nr:Lrp/AsnC family transcriptional regulator [Nitriliruptoraceae bacterium]
MSTLDRTDLALLGALQEDGRRTIKELAAIAGLSTSATHERVRRLQADGVISGIHAALDPEAIGIGLQAVIQVSLQRHSRDAVIAFRDHAMSLEEVLAVTHLTGAIDFLVHVAVRDTDHLRDLALEAFTTRDEVARLDTSVVYEHVGARTWPIYAVADPV